MVIGSRLGNVSVVVYQSGKNYSAKVVLCKCPEVTLAHISIVRNDGGKWISDMTKGEKMFRDNLRQKAIAKAEDNYSKLTQAVKGN